MTIADQERRNREIYREVVPRIAETVVVGGDTVELSSALSEETGVESRTVFRWVQHVERELDRARRLSAALVLLPLWLGALVALLSAGGWLLGFEPPLGAPWWVLLIAGTAVALLAALRLRGLADRARRRWIARELDRE